MSKKKIALTVAFAVLAVLTIPVLFPSCETTNTITDDSFTSGQITGLVAAPVHHSSAQDPSKRTFNVYLPDVKVIVTDAGGTQVSTSTTDLDGSYITKNLPPGNYQVCLEKNGFSTSCYDVEVKYAINYPGLLHINLADERFIYGQVLLADGSPGFYRQEVMGLNFHTTVELQNHPGKYKCNTGGEYLIPADVQAPSKIIATCQAAVVDELLQPGTQIIQDLTLPNNSPVINHIRAYEGGRAVSRTEAGANLSVKAGATDAEGHALKYIWYPWGNFPGFVNANADNVNWQLPNIKADYIMYLLVNDGYGGVAYRQYNILADDRMVRFSGTVKNIADDSPVKNALVSIGNATTTTDDNGYFALKVPENGITSRFVVNVEKAGFMPSSKIYFSDATGVDYPLVPATTQTFNTDEEIVLIEQEDDFTRFTRERQGDRPITRGPAQVTIPPNSIIDNNGNPFNGNVLVSLRTVDLFDENGLMPGDYGAEQDGNPKILESLGAISVEIRSEAEPEMKLNIDPEAFADIRIPIASPVQAFAQQEIDLWDYDSKSGIWMHIGALDLQGNEFVGQTNQFSFLNADIAFNDAACVVIRDNGQASLFPGAALTLKFQVPTSTGAPKYFTQVVNQADLPLVISRLPPNKDVSMEVYRIDTLLRAQVFNTGPDISGPAAIQPPDSICQTIFLYAPLPANRAHDFLFRQKNNSTNATKYYDLIGANNYNGSGNKITLAQWQNENNFTSGATDSAIYFNAGDLGFWRGMKMKQSGNKIAYYVSNYRSDIEAIADNNPFATVCMEYTPLVNNGINITKFYVFDGAGQLLDNANLDGKGPKNIPGLCIVCHGGVNLDYVSFVNTAALNTEYTNNQSKIPKYLHFDVQSFIYSDQTGIKRADQEDNLRNLNEKVLSTNETQAVREFIKKAYSDNNVNSNTLAANNFTDNAIVAGWDVAGDNCGVTHRDFYTHIVGPSCRGCHITRSSSSIWFNATNNFNGSAACGNVRYMPNALITYLNLWTYPSRVEMLENYLSNNNCANPISCD